MPSPNDRELSSTDMAFIRACDLFARGGPACPEPDDIPWLDEDAAAAAETPPDADGPHGVDDTPSPRE